MDTCKTVRIVAKNDDGFMDINESDFDEKVHKVFKPKAPTAAQKKAAEAAAKKEK